MSRLPELSYALSEARSTALLAEFNAILNLADTFGPLLPLDSAITFYAPLRSSLADLRGAPPSFERASEGVYLRNGLWRIAGDRNPRFGDNGLLMEPAATNKCENYNANPDESLTGLTLSGDPAATVSRVDDSAELELFGLSVVCSSGFAVLLDNSAGVSNADLIIDGFCGNLNDHTLSVVARGSGNIIIRLVGPTDTEQILDAHYQFYSVLETPAGTTREMMIRALPGTVCYFVLNQLEEAPIVSSPIITRGAAASRAKDNVSYGIDPVEAAEGMLILDWTPRFNNGDFPAGDLIYSGIFSLRSNSTASLVRYVRNTSNVDFFQVTDGVNVQNLGIDDPSKDVTFTYALRWSGSTYDQGYRRSDTGLWTWVAAPSPYKGDWVRDGGVWLGNPTVHPQNMRNVHVYNEDKGRQWIEDNYR